MSVCLSNLLLLYSYVWYNHMFSAADSTGTHSLYTTYKDFELMFHVSTMLPYTPNNRQQVSWMRFILIPLLFIYSLSCSKPIWLYFFPHEAQKEIFWRHFDKKSGLLAVTWLEKTFKLLLKWPFWSLRASKHCILSFIRKRAAWMFNKLFSFVFSSTLPFKSRCFHKLLSSIIIFNIDDGQKTFLIIKSAY